jgi:glycosyltransferase involved in cell wall biosynthesis
LYTGTLSPDRGLDALVAAAAKVREANCSVEIVIAGAGPLERVLRQEVLGRGLDDIVKILGWVDYGKVQELMWSCDWGIDLTEAPMWDDRDSVRGVWGQKPSQYLAAGLPVICWRIDGSEFLEEHDLGLLVEYRSVDDLARVLQKAARRATDGELSHTRIRAVEFARTTRSQVAVATVRCEMYQSVLGVGTVRR